MKVMLAVPMIGMVNPKFTETLVKVTADIVRSGAELIYANPTNMVPHDKPRNYVMKNAIKQGCDYVMFVDSDNLLPSGAFSKLLEVMQQQEDAVVVCGNYYQRGYPYAPVWVSIGPTGKPGYCLCKDDTADPPLLVHGGFGCALIDVKWTEKNLEKPYFVLQTDEEDHTAYEDAYFCRQVRRAGGCVYGAPKIGICGHILFPEVVTEKNVDRLRKEYILSKDK